MNTTYENNGLIRLAHDIYTVRHDEISYDEAAVLMERCADELLSDEESKAHFPQLWRYFKYSPDCYQEYQMLMDLARIEAAGELKVPETIPPMPTEKARGITEWFEGAKEAIGTLFSGFSGFTIQPAAQYRTGSMGLTYEAIEVELDEGHLLITFDVKPNKSDPQLRDLHCYVETEEETEENTIEEMLEFAPVWLQQAANGAVVQEQALNELGDVTFCLVSPGDYTFRLYLAGQEYVVENVVVP